MGNQKSRDITNLLYNYADGDLAVIEQAIVQSLQNANSTDLEELDIKKIIEELTKIQQNQNKKAA